MPNEIEQMDQQYVFGTWAFQKDVAPKQIVDTEGVRFTDADGNRYLDFSSQLMCSNIGHKNERVNRAMQEQAEQLAYVAPGFCTEARAKLGKKLAEITPGNLTKSFFSPSGTEANEAAMMIAQWYTGKQKIISRYHSYHGATYGSIGLTGDPRRWAAEPSVPGLLKAPAPYDYRTVFNDAMHTLDYIDEMLTLEGDTVAAVIVEPVVGSNGILVPPPEYLPKLKGICHDHGALLIADEVMSGFGRCGEWFACDLWDVTPDIMTVAKGITAAYLPLAATIVTDEIADYFNDRFFNVGHTYAGHAMTVAAALETIQVYEDENLIDGAREKGRYLMDQLCTLKDKHPCVGEVRGVGLFCGVELVKNPETKEPFDEYGAKVKGTPSVLAQASGKAREAGVYIVPMINTLIAAPPLTISQDEIDEGVRALDQALAWADAQMG